MTLAYTSGKACSLSVRLTFTFATRYVSFAPLVALATLNRCNRSVYSHLSLRPLPADFVPLLVDLPSSVVLDGEEESNGWKERGPGNVIRERYQYGNETW